MQHENSVLGSTKSPTIILTVLSLVLFLLNVMGFATYSESHPDENTSTQVWNYLDSDLFELLTISLILPIILLILESRFNLIRSFIQNRIQHIHTVEVEQRELARKRRDERSERRWETIQLT